MTDIISAPSPAGPLAREQTKAHGAGAQNPAEIPLKGWKDILWRVYDEIGEDRVLLVAGGVTFYILLAFVPGLTALISFYGLFLDRTTILDHLSLLQGVIPGGGLDIVKDQLQRITINSNTTLSLTSLISTGIALWSANAGIKGLFEAMNVAYGEHEKRSLIRLNVVTMTFTITALASMVAFMAIMIVLPQALAYLWLSESAKWLIKGLAFAGMFAMFAAGVAATYRWGPSRNEASWKWITPGTLLAVVVAAIVSVLFSWYVSNFGSYNATYGSLCAVIGFVTWIWILMIILIVGAELNAETEQQTAADTTVAPNEPPGQRGAHAADTSENPALEVSPKWRRKQPLHSEGPHKAGGRISIGQLAVALPAAALLYWYGKKQAAKVAREEHT